ncbi:MAG: hypothetical protein ACO2ZM_09790 [Francisellaceae bacterium]
MMKIDQIQAINTAIRSLEDNNQLFGSCLVEAANHAYQKYRSSTGTSKTRWLPQISQQMQMLAEAYANDSPSQLKRSFYLLNQIGSFSIKDVSLGYIPTSSTSYNTLLMCHFINKLMQETAPVYQIQTQEAISDLELISRDFYLEVMLTLKIEPDDKTPKTTSALNAKSIAQKIYENHQQGHLKAHILTVARKTIASFTARRDNNGYILPLQYASQYLINYQIKGLSWNATDEIKRAEESCRQLSEDEVDVFKSLLSFSCIGHWNSEDRDESFNTLFFLELATLATSNDLNLSELVQKCKQHVTGFAYLIPFEILKLRSNHKPKPLVSSTSFHDHKDDANQLQMVDNLSYND